jgi:hypothetical protein
MLYHVVEMGRIIHTENLSTERNRLMKAMAIAVRELARQDGFDSAAWDLAAFLALALQQVAESIERSVGPWEKRGYWVKADRFRMEWIWVEPMAQKLQAAILSDDVAGIAQIVAKLGPKLQEVQVPAKHRLGTPWVGAWEKMKQDSKA